MWKKRQTSLTLTVFAGAVLFQLVESVPADGGAADRVEISKDGHTIVDPL
jgi:hypothetical protein